MFLFAELEGGIGPIYHRGLVC